MALSRRLSHHGRPLSLLCMCLPFAWASVASYAGEANEKKAAPTVETVLRGVSDFYKKAGSISVTIEQRQDFGELKIDSTWTIDFERPNRLKLRVNQKGFPVLTAVSNGKTLSLLSAALRKYTVAPAPEAVSEIWDKTEAVLNVPFMQCVMQVELATDLCLSAPAIRDVMDGAKACSYAGLDAINGGKAHHLKFKEDKYDWELWVAAEGDPVVRRAVLDLSRGVAEANKDNNVVDADEDNNVKAKIIQEFTNWRINPKLDENTFVFQPPKGARKVEKIKQEPGDVEDAPHPLLGERAPDLNLKLLEKGDFRLAEHRGAHVVVLDFWATWCESCVAELPVLAEVAARYKQKGVVVCGITSEEADDVRTFLKEHKLGFRVALDAEHDIAGNYAVSAIPALVLIDKEGIVQSVHVGYDPSLKATLQKELDALLAGKDLSAEAPDAAR